MMWYSINYLCVITKLCDIIFFEKFVYYAILFDDIYTLCDIICKIDSKKWIYVTINSATTSHDNNLNILKTGNLLKILETTGILLRIMRSNIEKSKICDFMMWYTQIMCYHIIYVFNVKLYDQIKSSALIWGSVNHRF